MVKGLNMPQNISSFVKNLFKNLLGDRAGSLAADMRIHQRFRLRQPLIISAQINQKIDAVIHDLSYSGIAIKQTDGENIEWDAMPLTHPITIRSLDQTLNIDATRVYVAKGIAGFQFHHKTSESLVFLREILESMRIGSTIGFVEEEDTDKKPGRIFAISEDESVELEIKQAAEPALSREQNVSSSMIRLKFRHVDVNYILQFDGKNISMKTASFDHKADDRSLLKTDMINKPILRQAIYMLMGLQEESLEKAVVPFLGYSLQYFDVKTSSYRHKKN